MPTCDTTIIENGRAWLLCNSGLETPTGALIALVDATGPLDQLELGGEAGATPGRFIAGLPDGDGALAVVFQTDQALYMGVAETTGWRTASSVIAAGQSSNLLGLSWHEGAPTALVHEADASGTGALVLQRMAAEGLEAQRHAVAEMCAGMAGGHCQPLTAYVDASGTPHLVGVAARDDQPEAVYWDIRADGKAEPRPTLANGLFSVDRSSLGMFHRGPLQQVSHSLRPDGSWAAPPSAPPEFASWPVELRNYAWEDDSLNLQPIWVQKGTGVVGRVVGGRSITVTPWGDSVKVSGILKALPSGGDPHRAESLARGAVMPYEGGAFVLVSRAGHLLSVVPGS